MNPEPPRLADDPSFLAETGCNLADEASALESPRLPELRARLMASLAASPAPIRSPRWPWAGGGALLLAVVWFMWPDPPRVPADVPTPTGAVTVVSQGATPPPASAPNAAPATGLPSGPAPTIPPKPPLPAARPSEQIVATTRGAEADAAVKTPVVPPMAAPPDAPPPLATTDAGDLARQLTAFELGEDRFAEGDSTGALAAYEAYLHRWPAGHFRAEAEIARLRATAALGDAAAAEALAARLADDPALATRRTEILTLRLSALVRLGRCEEARALGIELAANGGKKLAAACR